ncbi:MAG: response regulator [Candidatus Omnitrophica bacterium]|nr:response regulator [Candidatus Omnitrophota bacterium]
MTEGKYIILLVEDEADLRGLLAKKLDKAGFEVHQAENGQKGLELAKRIMPDLIICDVVMPEKDGNYLLKELKKTEFGQYTPFVILTARPKMRDYFEVVGVDDFIEKPVKGGEFIERIQKILLERGEQIKLKRQKVLSSKRNSASQGSIESEYSEELSKTEIFKKDKKNSLEISQERKDVHDADKKQGRDYPVRRTILVIENDPFILKNLRSLLIRRNYDVAVSCSHEECLKAVSNLVPDVIITKNALPQIRGEQLASRLKRIPALRNVPIIIYSKIIERNSAYDDDGQYTITDEGEDLLGTVIKLMDSIR